MMMLMMMIRIIIMPLRGMLCYPESHHVVSLICHSTFLGLKWVYICRCHHSRKCKRQPCCAQATHFDAQGCVTEQQ